MSDRDTTAGIASPPPQDGGLRFIPFRRRDIVSMCLHHGGLDTAQAQQHFATAKAVIQTHFQQEFHAIKQQLKDAYAPLDPDADTRSIPLTATPGGPGATGSPEPGLMETLERVLDRANYEKVSGQTLRQALRTASLFQLRLYIDLDDYDEVLLYTRGATRREETLREFFGLWRRTVRFTNFDRVLLYIRARPDLDGDGAVGQLQPGSTVLKLFQNVPEADLEMLFPNIRIGMRPLDKLMITVPALISGGAVITTKTGATLLLLGSAMPAIAESGIYAPPTGAVELEERVARLRRQGKRVIRALPGAEVEPCALGCDRMLVHQQGEWQVVPLADSRSTR